MKICLVILVISTVGLNAFHIPFNVEQDYPQLRRDLPPSRALSDYLYWLALYKRKLQRFGFYPIVTEDDLKYSQGKEIKPSSGEVINFSASDREIVESNREKLAGINKEAKLNVNISDQASFNVNSDKNVQQSEMYTKSDVIVENLEDIPLLAVDASDPIIHILPSEETSNGSEIFDAVFENDEDQIAMMSSIMSSIDEGNVNSLADMIDIAEDFDETGEVELEPVDDLIAMETVKEESVSASADITPNHTQKELGNSVTIIVDAAQLPEDDTKAVLEPLYASDIIGHLSKGDPADSPEYETSIITKNNDTANPVLLEQQTAVTSIQQALKGSADANYTVPATSISPAVKEVNAEYHTESKQQSQIDTKEQQAWHFEDDQTETLPISPEELLILLGNSADDEITDDLFSSNEIPLQFQVDPIENVNGTPKQSEVVNLPLISSAKLDDAEENLAKAPFENGHNYIKESNSDAFYISSAEITENTSKSTLPVEPVKNQDESSKSLESIISTNESEKPVPLHAPPEDQLELRNNFEFVSDKSLEQLNDLSAKINAKEKMDKVNDIQRNISANHEIVPTVPKDIEEMIHTSASITPNGSRAEGKENRRFNISKPDILNPNYSQLQLLGLAGGSVFYDEPSDTSSSKKRILDVQSVHENSEEFLDQMKQVEELKANLSSQPDTISDEIQSSPELQLNEIPLASEDLKNAQNLTSNEATPFPATELNKASENSPLYVTLVNKKETLLTDYGENIDRRLEHKLHELESPTIVNQDHESLMYRVIPRDGLQGTNADNEGRSVVEPLPVGRFIMKMNSLKEKMTKYQDRGRSDIPIDYE